MTIPRMYTATYNSKEHTLCIAHWVKLLGRSTAFVYSRLSLAETKNEPSHMQFVIEESEKARQDIKPVKDKDKRAPSRMSPADAKRQAKQKRFYEQSSIYINSFLYPQSAVMMEKREHVVMVDKL